MFDIQISEEALGNNPKARDALFDDEDAASLREIQDLRKQLTNKLTRTEDGKLFVPDKTSDKVLLAQLIDGTERLIMTKARLKISSKTEEALGDLNDVVCQALKGFHARARIPATAEERTIPADYLKIDDVPGEMDIGNIPMTMAEITKGV